MTLDNYFFKYISVGVINTLLTFLVTFFCYKVLNMDYRISYAIGFFIGFLNSLVLNNIYTFKKRNNQFNLNYLVKFSSYFLLVFLVSEITLMVFVELLHFYELVSIAFSMIVYTLFSYILFEKFVFISKGNK